MTLTNFLLLALNFFGVPDSTQSLLFCQDRVAVKEAASHSRIVWQDEITACMKSEGFIVAKGDTERVFIPENKVMATLDSIRTKLVN